jgi:gas vesicle protein
LVLPGVGSTIGTIAGGVIGGTAANFVANKGVSAFFKSDSDEMYEIISDKFETLAFDYLISEDEADEIVDELKDELSGDVLKDMYQSEDREQFAEELMEPLFLEKAQSRETITMPTEEETRAELVSMLDGVVFIH